jgi:hypothetical protein
MDEKCPNCKTGRTRMPVCEVCHLPTDLWPKWSGFQQQADLGRRAVGLLQRLQPWINGDDIPTLLGTWGDVIREARAAGMLPEICNSEQRRMSGGLLDAKEHEQARKERP